MKRRIVSMSVALVLGMAALAGAGQLPGEGVAPQEHSAHASEGPPLTLRAAIDEALAVNLDVAALKAQVDVTRQRPAQEHSLAPPMAEAQIWQWPINTLNPANTNMYMFMVSQDLPGRGKRDARAAVVTKDIELADADVTIRARQIVNETTQAYWALFIARKATEIHLASVDVLRDIADAAQAKYTSGRGSQADLLKPVVEISKLHSDVIMHDQEAGLAMARLNVLLDRAPETPIGLLDELHEDVLLPTSADLQQLAIAHQPELQRAQIEIQRASAELASVRLERKPDFNVQGGYLVMPNQTDALLAKVGVTWPNAPWARGRVDAKIAEQAAGVTTATSRERTMENMVRLAVQEAYVRAKAAQDRASLLRTTIIPQSRQAFDAARAAYQADRTDFATILDSQRGLLDARLAYLQALADLAQATADLERAIGTELPSGTTTRVSSPEGQ